MQNCIMKTIMKTIDEIFKQVYIDAEDLRIIIPSIGINQARRYIKDIQGVMESDGCYIPKTKTKLVLTSYVKKYFGIKR